MKDKKIRWLIVFICCISVLSVALSGSFVYADSYVEKPNKNDWRYKTYDPYSQTKTYKVWYTNTQSVSSVIYANKRAKKFVKGELVSYTADIMAVGSGALLIPKIGALAPKLATKNTLVGVAMVGVKYTVIGMANRDIKYLNKLAKGKVKEKLKCVTRVKFKWTNPDKFKYKIAVERYYTYSGKQVGKKQTVYYTGSM